MRKIISTEAWPASGGVSSPSIPKLSKRNIEFDPNQDRWKLTENSSVNVGFIRNGMMPSLANSCIEVLAWSARRYAVATVRGFLFAIKQFLKYHSEFLGAERLSSFEFDDLTKFRASACRRDGHEETMGPLRSFLDSFIKLGQSGVTADTVARIKEWKLPQREKGVVAKGLDPVKGALNVGESAQLNAALIVAYERSEITFQNYVAALMSSFTGYRPQSIAWLKCGDLNVEAGTLRMTLLKIRHTETGFREAFREHTIERDLFAALVLQRNKVQQALKHELEKVGLSLQPNDMSILQDQLALFPNWTHRKEGYTGSVHQTMREVREALSVGRHADALQGLFDDASSPRWHMYNANITTTLQKAVALLDVRNPDNKPLQVNALRLRHTKATSMRKRGASLETTGYTLGHTSVYSVRFYEKITPDHAHPIQKSMLRSPKGARVVHMFLGKVVPNGYDEEDVKPSEGRIEIEGEDAAACASRMSCDFSGEMIPAACYMCLQFRPWENIAPHEAFLNLQLKERERRLQVLAPTKDLDVITAMDELISSIVNVIEICKERQADQYDKQVPSNHFNDALLSTRSRAPKEDIVAAALAKVAAGEKPSAKKRVAKRVKKTPAGLTMARRH